MVGKPVAGSSSVSGCPNGLMLLAADAGAVAATPMPTVIAMAAAALVSLFMSTPVFSHADLASYGQRYPLSRGRNAIPRSARFAVGPPLPFRLGETVSDHLQGFDVVPIAEMSAVHFDVLGLGRRATQAALPRHNAVGL